MLTSVPTTSTLIKNINRRIAEQIDASNIAGFQVIKKDLTIEMIYLNMDLLTDLFDQTLVAMLDKIVRHAVCLEAAACLEREVNDTTVASIVGVWNSYTLYTIAALHISYMTNSDTGEKFITSLPYEMVTTAELEELPEDKYMKLTEYNSAKFAYVFQGIVLSSIKLIISSITLKLPFEMIYSPRMSKHIPGTETCCLTWMYHDIMRQQTDHSDAGLLAAMDSPATSLMVSEFIRLYEKAMFTGFTGLLRRCGLSSTAINTMLISSRTHVVYSDPMGHKLRAVELTVRIVSKADPQRSVDYKTKIGTIYRLSADWSPEDIALPNFINRQEGTLRRFIRNLATFTINEYIETKRDTK